MARMYDPETGRFLQEDTYRGDIKDPLSLNLYTYCHNNPIAYDDPAGHFINFLIAGAIRGAILGFLGKGLKVGSFFEKYGINAIFDMAGNAAKQMYLNGKINLAEVALTGGVSMLFTKAGKQPFKFAGAAKTTEVGKKLAGSISKIKETIASKAKSITDKLPINKAKELVFDNFKTFMASKKKGNIKLVGWFEDEAAEVHPNGIFENAPYHRKTNNSVKNKAPSNGQAALDNSIPLKSETTQRRIGVSNGEFIVFDITTEGVFHGHVRTWSELISKMRSVFQKAGLTDKKGNVIQR